VFINPEILSYGGDVEAGREGCFSTGKVVGIVPRYNSIVLQAYTPTGEQITTEYHGSLAKTFQHEVDHLDGIRFPDRIENDDDLHYVEPHERAEYRRNPVNWPKKCPRDDWEAIKGL
jgi:peptide deformylase